MAIVKGSKIVFLYRVYNTNTAGACIAYTTENGLSISNDADSTVTKDGTVRTPGEPEIEITATSFFKKGDTLIKTLRDAMLNGSLLEIWRANLEDPKSSATSNNQYKGTYYRGYLTSFEETSNAEDDVTYSLTFSINGKGADGDVTVTAEQYAESQYAFADTTAGSTGETGSTGA